MASDLSKLIEDNLCSTLTALLSKDATIKETTKAHEKDLADTQTLKIDSTFEFTNITSTWSFIIPAYTASYIFNTMLGDTSEPIDEIDADITDAIQEVIANVSGGLSTIINGSDLEDLGAVKSSTSLDGVIEKGQIKDIDNMFKILIDLDGIDITIFILFDKVIMPFIDAISKSKASFYSDDEVLEEIKPDTTEIDSSEIENLELSKDETIEKEDQNIKTDNNTDKEPTAKEKENSDKTDNLDEIELSAEEIKAKKLKKLIIIIAGLISFTIISGLIMFFMGMFDPEPIVVKDTNKTKTIKTKDNVDIVKYQNKNIIKFTPSEINIKRLNARLKELTKYKILTLKEIRDQNNIQKERLNNLKKEELLIKFSKLNKEEKLNIDNNSINKLTKTKNNNNKLKFILVDSLKYKLFKKMILKINTKKARISICKNRDGRTAVYIGPFEDKNSQFKMKDLIKQKEPNLGINLSNITQEEFNARCSF